MKVLRVWRLLQGYLSEWDGVAEGGAFVHVRCKRNAVEVRSRPDCRPGIWDTTLVVGLDYPTIEGPSYAAVRDALRAAGVDMPDADDAIPEPIPEFPPAVAGRADDAGGGLP